MKEQVELYYRGDPVGHVTLQPEGNRTEICAVMSNPGDGLYRAALVGERGELPLGVMEPAGKDLTVCRRPYTRDVQRLGMPLRAVVRCTFPFAANRRWQETRNPAQLFRGSFLRDRLARCGFAWWQREGERLYLALPLSDQRPFPLESMFCMAEIRSVGGRRCVVYAFDREEEPILPTKA